MVPATVSSKYYSMVDRLARVTTSGRRIRELDGLRFIAIATVFVQHVLEVMADRYPQPGAVRWDFLSTVVLDWHVGVQLFFVISGFILAAPFAAQHLLGARRVSLKAYYWRRLTRLEPPYLLAMLLCFLTLVFYWGQSARALWPHLLASMFYLHNIVYYSPGTMGFSIINPVAWSLEIEVQFYILAPVLAWVFLIPHKWLRRGVILGFSAALEEGLKLVAHVAPHRPETLLNYLPMFLMGFVLADVYLTDWEEQPRADWRFDLIALPGWLLLLVLFFEQQRLFHHVLLRPMTFPFILLILCWASFRSEYTRRFLASSFIMTTGGMCYSIYLLHLPLLRVLARYAPVPLVGSNLAMNLLVYSLVWGVPVLGVSILYFMAIEKPCMRKDWPQRLWAMLSGRRPPVALEGTPPATASLPRNQPVP
jgi:peptidoglycan/LPS O-acetylase OafA/YrhL